MEVLEGMISGLCKKELSNSQSCSIIPQSPEKCKTLLKGVTEVWAEDGDVSIRTALLEGKEEGRLVWRRPAVRPHSEPLVKAAGTSPV